MLPRALVVEDDAKTREALCAIIAGEGFAVDSADDGEMALTYLERESYKLILLDIVLRKVSGAAVMEHLSTTNPSALENVVVVSGLDVTEIRKIFPTVRHALSKPVLPSRLRATVRKSLQRHGASDSGISVA
jgi:DNA-binding response OmpR family regulator